MLQRCGELIDVGGGDVDGRSFEQGCAVAAYGISADLDQQGLNHIGVEFLRGKAYEIKKRTSHLVVELDQRGA